VRPLHAAAGLLLAATLVAGCGGGDESAVAGAQASGTPTQQPASTPQPCADLPPTEEPRPGTGTDLAQKPAVEPAQGPPPCGLVLRDVVVGDGAEVTTGSQVRAKYVGAFYDSGEEFDSSWRIGPDQTLPFEVGAGNLIADFDQGVLGMREGGRREVVVPSELGYGSEGVGPIPPDATLVFVIDVVGVDGA
jgi:FKBP-type peptidyl-prolyl cis-trans isomerase